METAIVKRNVQAIELGDSPSYRIEEYHTDEVCNIFNFEEAAAVRAVKKLGQLKRGPDGPARPWTVFTPKLNDPETEAIIDIWLLGWARLASATDLASGFVTFVVSPELQN